MVVSNKRVITLKLARHIVTKLYHRLSPHCDLFDPAGSVRREKNEVGDIEIVCLPKKQKVGAIDLFGNDDRKEVVREEFTLAIKSLGKIEMGKTDGRQMKIILDREFDSLITHDIQLDLFMPQRDDYYRQLAIRTGSAEYSHKVIASGWLKMGWCGTSLGLRLQSECNGVPQPPDGKIKWSIKPDVLDPVKPMVWKSEQEFFAWLGVQYLHPKMRTVNY